MNYNGHPRQVKVINSVKNRHDRYKHKVKPLSTRHSAVETPSVPERISTRIQYVSIYTGLAKGVMMTIRVPMVLIMIAARQKPEPMSRAAITILQMITRILRSSRC